MAHEFWYITLPSGAARDRKESREDHINRELMELTQRGWEPHLMSVAHAGMPGMIVNLMLRKATS